MMASDTVIRAEHLDKKYTIGHRLEVERYIALRDVIARTIGGWTRSARSMLRGEAIIAGDETEEFWALRNVCFEIRRGEVVGIIGRNGAGKSTLLKVLSRITEPSGGRATIEGRVASLLEVGTGFHPELTGRENVYLNGAILGMTRAEIRAKFDEIVAFAEVEKFLDTPVKRYSSGMYVRLAFAVAAHMDFEILVIDEVLAVGDAEFQRKCLGKMEGVAERGRTVLFVSHNMAAIQSLCSRSILLRQGEVMFDGKTADAVAKHLSIGNIAETSLQRSEGRRGKGQFRFLSARVGPLDSRETTIMTGKPIKFELEIGGPHDTSPARSTVEIAVSNQYGEVLFECYSDVSLLSPLRIGGSKTLCTCVVEQLPLSGAEYTFSLYLERAGVFEDLIDVAGKFQVLDRPFFKTSLNCQPGREGRSVLVPHVWEVTPYVQV
jgi:lipopolysaccharide transport system ATP-binding protein